MPEWPDLHVLRERLAARLVGREVTGARVHNPVVLRAIRPLAAALAGRRLDGVAHRGKFLRLEFAGEVRLVVNPMLTGLFHLQPAGARVPKDTGLGLSFEDGWDLRYRDEKQMGKVYLQEGPFDPDAIPGYAGLGPEARLDGVTAADFARLARARQSEVRNLLLDQGFIAGIGNAYADEILFAAGLHPKRKVRSLGDDDLGRLYHAIRGTVAAAVQAVAAGLPPELGAKVRDHMQVRGRAGAPCRTCGTRIVRRSLGYLEADFCPRCQPAPAGQLY